MYLGPAGQSRFDSPPERVIPDSLIELTIMGNGVGAWPDQRHAAIDHIEELRQFIDAGAAQNAAKIVAKDSRFVAVFARN